MPNISKCFSETKKDNEVVRKFEIYELANLEFDILSKCSGSSALMVCDSLACLGFSSFIGETGKVAPFVSLIDDFFGEERQTRYKAWRQGTQIDNN